MDWSLEKHRDGCVSSGGQLSLADNDSVAEQMVPDQGITSCGTLSKHSNKFMAIFQVPTHHIEV